MVSNPGLLLVLPFLLILPIVSCMAREPAPMKPPAPPSETSRRLLLKAAFGGDIETVKSLVEQGVNVDTSDRDHTNALMWAAHGGQTEIASYLLRHGAWVNLKNGDQSTALMLAVETGKLDIVTLLLDHGANINERNRRGESALSLAISSPLIKKDRRKMVRLLVDRGAESWEGMLSSFNLAATVDAGDFEITAILAELGADVNGRLFQSEETVLIYAARKGRVEIVRVLLAHGADIHAQMPDGGTALSVARKHGQTQVAQLLEAADAKR